MRQPHKMVKHTQTICVTIQTNCLSVFDHLLGLVFKGLSPIRLVSSAKLSNFFENFTSLTLARVLLWTYWRAHSATRPQLHKTRLKCVERPTVFIITFLNPLEQPLLLISILNSVCIVDLLEGQN